MHEKQVQVQLITKPRGREAQVTQKHMNTINIVQTSVQTMHVITKECH